MKKVILSILGIVLVTSLSACNLFKSEKQRFIDATVESTCYIFDEDNVYNENVEAAVKDIYAKHGFESQNKEVMEALAAKYKSDEAVQEEILKSINDCGGNMEGEVDTELPMMEEEQPTDEEVVVDDAADEEEETASADNTVSKKDVAE